jgi:hypothetical protein
VKKDAGTAGCKREFKSWKPARGKPFKEALGVTSVRAEREYARARATMDALLDAIAGDVHPLVPPTVWIG